jgi:hypothetical protein
MDVFAAKDACQQPSVASSEGHAAIVLNRKY